VNLGNKLNKNPLEEKTKPYEKKEKPYEKQQEKLIEKPYEKLYEKAYEKQQEKAKINNIFDEYLEILKELFESMDDDGDGVISSDKIDLSNINPGFLEIIQDVLLKVDEERSWLNFQRFLNQIEENHLEVKIHNVKIFFFLILKRINMGFFSKWMSKNYASFEKLDKIYENLTPKHIQVNFFSFVFLIFLISGQIFKKKQFLKIYLNLAIFLWRIRHDI